MSRALQLQMTLRELEIHRAELEAQNQQLQNTQLLLEDSLNRYADLYDHAPVAYISMDKNGCIKRLNLLAAELLGCDRNAVIGIPLAPWIAHSYIRHFFDHLRNCNVGGDRIVAELSMTVKGKGQRWVQFTSVRSKHELGSDAALIRTALVDVTERKQLEDERQALLFCESAARAEAENLNQAKDQFLAALSHELRTPIQSVLMWTQMLRSRKLSDNDVRIGLSTIEQSVRNQSNLINSMLDASKMMMGKLDLELKSLELGECLQTAFDAARPEAEAKLLRLSVDFKGKSAKIKGDPNRLQQIFGNLLSNAIKFTNTGGLIQISLDLSDTDAIIRFIDNGTGILKEELPSIFERFVCSSDRGRRGLGLGLTIARDLVQLHDGTISAESEGKGKGSTFTITLPLAGA